MTPNATLRLVSEAVRTGLSDAPRHVQHAGQLRSIELAIVPNVRHGHVVQPALRFGDGSLMPLGWFDALGVHRALEDLLAFAPAEVRNHG